MHDRPLVIGADMTPGFEAGYRLSLLLQTSGGNSGNILFSEALFRSIANAKKTHSYHPGPDRIGDSDVIIISAANWLRPTLDLTWLVDWIERTPIPITIVGLGAQGTTGQSAEDLAKLLPPATVRAVRALSERSKSISVRGLFSQDVLAAVGVKNTVATGCPSLLLFKPTTLKPVQRDTGWTDVALHGTRYSWGRSTPVQEWFYRKSFFSGADIILQSEHPEIAVLDRDQDQKTQDRASKILSLVYGSGDSDVSRHIHTKAHIFWTFEDWITFLATKRFCFGTRIHGAIAALCAGIPATLVAHDSRTVELAETLNIPYIKEADTSFGPHLTPFALYDEPGMMRFYASQVAYKNTFNRFFEENGIRINPPDQSSPHPYHQLRAVGSLASAIAARSKAD